jgi:SAM-dependent methyltransferase
MIDDEIAAHYELGLEGARLRADGSPRLEYLRTLELLDRFVPAGADVLDVGGGTGVYALPLRDAGCSVRLLDPMPGHVEVAAAAGIDAALGDARALDEPDGSYDAVLLLGPLYHLVERGDRVLALREAHRVLRPGGVVLAAAISRYASLLDGMARALLDDPVFVAIVEQDLADGQHRNPVGSYRPGYFTTAFFHLPEELAEEADEAGFEDVRVLPIEGPGWVIERGDVPMELLLVGARLAESEPALLPASAHLLAVGRRPPAPTG